VVAVHGGVPFALSRLDDRVDRHHRPKPVMRAVGLLTAAAGAALLAWALAAHYDAAPQGWSPEPRPTPEYLLQRGAYRFSRNPMYLGAAVVWLGWALFYRSLPVWTGLAILCAAVPEIVRWEERLLLERFGDDYKAYLAAVPRWIGFRASGDPRPSRSPSRWPAR
jgi:protein-S-isoprenylcysteine O-methyltransferase Ste14